MTPQQAALARWSAPIPLPLIPASGALLADGKALLWSGDSPMTYGASGRTFTVLFDPVTGTVTERMVTDTRHEMFCPGTARLPDGKLLVNGGWDAAVTSIYDPVAGTWTRAASMSVARGYQASVPLADGSVLTVGGSWSGPVGPKPAELFSPATGWRTLSGITTATPSLVTKDVAGMFRADNHMWLVPMANGRVLHAGPAATMHWMDTSGNGSLVVAGPRADDTDSMSGNAVMFDAGQVLTVGGSVNYDGIAAKSAAFVIDARSGMPVARRVSSMAYPRVFANSIVLPNGQVVVIGGQTFGRPFSDNNSVLAPELFDPQTQTFTVLPPMTVPRNYHSIAMLLPDGRVLSAGGGLCGGCAGDHPDAEILSPPYLFNADGSAASRPAITSAPAVLGYGSTVAVDTDGPVTGFALVRLGATTHTVDNDQRRVAVSFTLTGTNRYELAVPSNPGILLPGQWMLFALNANGTPSVARMVTVNPTGAPRLLNPGDLTLPSGQFVDVALSATTPGGTLSFAASGLPAGLAIDAATGRITGTPAVAGSYVVTVRASNGTQTVSTDVLINVPSTAGPGTGTGLLAQYFGNVQLTGAPVLQRVEAPDADWGLAAPAPAVPADGFSARWTGWLEPAKSGPTLLRTLSDEGVRVWVDHRLVIDNWTAHSSTATDTTTLNLTAGQRVPVVVEYQDISGAAVMRLQWQPPGDSAPVGVPASRLYPAAAPSLENLALGKPATQNNQYTYGSADKAVDGRYDGIVTHTESLAPNDWWQVDLGSATQIDRVQLWNRMNCCSERLSNFTLMVSSTDPTGRSYAELMADPAVIKRRVGVTPILPTLSIPVDAVGRWVRVQLDGRNYLSIAEAEVFGRTVGGGTGLLAQYFGNVQLTGAPVLQRVEAPDADWGLAAPAPAVPADGFSARWTGWLEPTRSGPTLLRTLSDEGVRVWVDHRLVIDNWTAHSSTATDTTTLNLTAGQRVPVVVEYQDVSGAAVMRLQWQPPGDSAPVGVPASRLYPAAAPSLENLALGKPATQNNQYTYGSADKAVDGRYDGIVTHTESLALNDWWQVDLGSAAQIDRVQLWNRMNCCSERLSNFTLMVSSTDPTGRSYAELMADPAVIKRRVGVTPILPTLSIPVDAVGRWVRVQLDGRNYLSIAEAEVFGQPGAGTGFGTPTLAPVVNQQTALGAAVNLAVTASDPNGNALSYSASGLPPGLGINAASGLISGAPSTAGSYTVTVTARNAGELSASTSFAWLVLGGLPEITPIPAPAASTGSISYSPVVSAGAAARYSWNFGDGTPVTAWADSPATSHSFAAPGVYTVTLTATTADGRSTTYSFAQAIFAAGVRALSPSSSNLIVEPASGGRPSRVWVLNPDNDSVSVFDASGSTRLAEINVGTAPRSLARAADGRIWVVNKDAASISIVNPAQLAVAQTVVLPRASQPYGIVFSPLDGSAFVTLEAAGRVLKLNGSTGATLLNQVVGDFPRHVSVNAAGTQLLVSRFITPPLRDEGTAAVKFTSASGAVLGGQVLRMDPATLALLGTTVLAHSTRTDAENQGRGIPNYLGAAAIAPDGRSAWVPSKQDNVSRGALRDGLPLNFQNTVRAVSSRINLVTGAEDLPARVDHDNASVASAAAYHPTGTYLFVTLETSRQVAVMDAAGQRELFRFEVGLAPQGLAVSDDGLKLHVHNFMDRSLSTIDLTPLMTLGRWGAADTVTRPSVGAEKQMGAANLRGKQLFYDARDPRLSRDSYMSCATCHNDGGHDGRVWDFTGQGEGLRNTPALRGRQGTGHGHLHWSANFDEVQDFEGQIRGLAGGTGLMADADYTAGTRSQPLGMSKAGLSADLDALATYVTLLGPAPASPYRSATGALTADALAGKALFASRNCGSCHGGAGFTLSAGEAQLKNIGTLKASSGQRLGGLLAGVDIPGLRDVWATAPYLHDGSAPTLAAAVQAHSGTTLAATELTQLVAYLQQIGSEEPAANSNLALGRTASQSSTGWSAPAVRAVDGNTDGNFDAGSVTHTNGTSARDWWEVDLGATRVIDSVQLWNRTDCCIDRLSNFYVLVSSAPMSGRSLSQLLADASVRRVQVVSLNGNRTVNLGFSGASGRYVRVQLSGTNPLSLAEVQVLGR